MDPSAGHMLYAICPPWILNLHEAFLGRVGDWEQMAHSIWPMGTKREKGLFHLPAMGRKPVSLKWTRFKSVDSLPEHR